MCVVFNDDLIHWKTEIFINTFDLTDWKIYFDFTLKTTVKVENEHTNTHRKPGTPTHGIFALIIFLQHKATSKCLLLSLLYVLGKENFHQQKAYRSTSIKT